MRKVLVSFIILVILMGVFPPEFYAELIQEPDTTLSDSASETSVVTDDVYDAVEDLDQLEQEEDIPVTEEVYSTQRYIVELNNKASSRLRSIQATTVADDVQKLELLDNTYVMDLTMSEVNELIMGRTATRIEIDQPMMLATIQEDQYPAEKGQDESAGSGMNPTHVEELIPWGIYSTGANLINETPDDKKVKVAVFDTGISDHSDLIVTKKVSFIDNEPEVDDLQGHGTHMSGTIAALRNHFGIRGVTNNVELYSVKVIGMDGKGYASNIINGLNWAIENNIKVINMSFVGNEYSESLHEAIQLAREHGILIIAAAGNNGKGENTMGYPALYPEVVAVGSVNQSHKRSTFSSTGNELDIVAPGSVTLSTYSHDSYKTLSGTSSATAYVSGSAALIWSQNPSLSVEDVTYKMYSSATPLGTEHEYGHGLLNVAKALGVTDKPIPPFDETFPEEGEEGSVLPPILDEGEYGLTAYDFVGDRQEIIQGQSATVSLKLNGGLQGENMHLKVNIEVFPKNAPDAIVEHYVFDNPELNKDIAYSWQTNEDTAPGEYVIKYSFPNIKGSQDDKEFIITVVPGQVIPIDQTLAKPTGLQATATAEDIKLTWDAMPGAEGYIVRLNGAVVGQVQDPVYSFNGLQSETQYSLSVAAIYKTGNSPFSTITVSTKINELIVNVPQRPTIKVGKPQWFVFRPASTGTYKIFTSSAGALTDTQLWIYEGGRDTDAILHNDDIKGSVFSELKLPLNGGETYYVKLSGYEVTDQQVEIQAQVISSDIPYIQLNENKDINEAEGDSPYYVFVPGSDGRYKISTSYYKGSSANRNDTTLTLYSNIAMSKKVPGGYNDDNELSEFSTVELQLVGGTPYYIKVGSYGSLKARLKVTQQELSFVPLVSREVTEVVTEENQQGYYSFTPTKSGKYRFYTSSNRNRLQDTMLELYSNASLTNLMAANDDVQGIAPYGELYSKIEYTLNEGQTYYLKVSNRDPGIGLRINLAVEDAFQSTRATAQYIEWDEQTTEDKYGQNLSATSLYDVDYYKVILDSGEQVDINLSEGRGQIEDGNGNIYGYFGLDIERNFNLAAGTYYYRVQNHLPKVWSSGSTSKLEGYKYALGNYINDLELVDRSSSETSESGYGVTGNLEDRGQTNPLDATPDGKQKLRINYISPVDVDQLIMTIEVASGFPGTSQVYKQVKHNVKKGVNVPFYWSGEITAGRLDFGRELNGKYYAEDGIYHAYIMPADKKTWDPSRRYVIHVANDPLGPLSIIPLPPSKNSEGKIVTEKNRKTCDTCENYYRKYIYTPFNVNYPNRGMTYGEWAAQIYGKTGIEKFIAATDAVFFGSPEDEPLDRLLKLSDTAGLVPVLGIPADGVSIVVNLMKGDIENALISGVGIIPVVGEMVKGGKKVAGVLKVIDVFEDACNCFAPGTPVHTDKGMVPIEDIQVGDMVLSKNDQTGEQAYKRVSYTFDKQVNELYHIRADGATISATYNHPFWIKGKGWKLAEELVVGDQLVTNEEKYIVIDQIEVEATEATVYNFTVEDFHTYYVTNLGIWTHNTACNLDVYKKVLKGSVPAEKTITRLTTTKGQPSTILGAELTAAGVAKPNISNDDIRVWAAHHIVATSDKASRDLLRAAGIPDHNVAANGVWLPSGHKGHGNNMKFNNEVDQNSYVWSEEIANHSGGHAPEYYEYVYKKLLEFEDSPDNPDATLRVLQEIREELLSGKLKLKNPIN
ncbi:S8 family serine peptidase [Paenibacillus massiliensis]|uniref:S8 family serine peptidase n=1 Tax=Paenibacillus massiliensis TaxID=225917 RepID=UPI0004B2C411|nr:S8 family serine peptidase [Paenibacillus massiliensis]